MEMGPLLLGSSDILEEPRMNLKTPEYKGSGLSAPGVIERKMSLIPADAQLFSN